MLGLQEKPELRVALVSVEIESGPIKNETARFYANETSVKEPSEKVDEWTSEAVVILHQPNAEYKYCDQKV